MGRQATLLLPKQARLLEEVGKNLRLARLRRKLSAEQVAERAGISQSILQKVEKGDPSTAVGNVLQVLMIHGLEQDILLLAAQDPQGRKLQDTGLAIPRQRAPKRKMPRTIDG